MESDDASELTRRIIACVINVHNTLGPGFIEPIYHNAMIVELRKAGLRIDTEKRITIWYEGSQVGVHRMDLVVEDTVIVELKAVTEQAGIHYSKLRSYLRASNLKTGLLVNFSKEKANTRRVQL